MCWADGSPAVRQPYELESTLALSPIGSSAVVQQHKMQSTSFGPGNQGQQVGQNYGTINAEFHLPPGKTSGVRACWNPLTLACRASRNAPAALRDHPFLPRPRLRRPRRPSRPASPAMFRAGRPCGSCWPGRHWVGPVLGRAQMKANRQQQIAAGYRVCPSNCRRCTQTMGLLDPRRHAGARRRRLPGDR